MSFYRKKESGTKYKKKEEREAAVLKKNSKTGHVLYYKTENRQ